MHGYRKTNLNKHNNLTIKLDEKILAQSKNSKFNSPDIENEKEGGYLLKITMT